MGKKLGILLTLVFSLMASTGFAKGKTIPQRYQEKCENEIQRPLDVRNRICTCLTKKMLEKEPAANLAKLLVEQPVLTEEEAAKEVNVDVELNSLQHLEHDILEDCIKKESRR